jgi:hypothetical protein
MNEKQLDLICNGIAAIADATDTPFTDVLEEITGTIVSEEDAGSIMRHMENF